jgi:hypothetical protein
VKWELLTGFEIGQSHRLALLCNTDRTSFLSMSRVPRSSVPGLQWPVTKKEQKGKYFSIMMHSLCDLGFSPEI